MTDALTHITTRATTQSEPVIGRTDQVENAAGGYVFAVDDRARVRRFLILGTDGGTYYTAERELTVESARFLIELAGRDPELIVTEAVEISTAGRAPRNNQALFAVALVAGVAGPDGRAAALAALPAVARTATHLFQFVTYVRQFRGWGRSLVRAVGAWYSDKDVDALALQMVKYRNRSGWTHRDLLRLSHPATTEADRAALFSWAVSGELSEDAPALLAQYAAVAAAAGDTDAVLAALEGTDLPWESVPTTSLGDWRVWASLLRRDALPIGALLRNLGRMSAAGVFAAEPDLVGVAAGRIVDPARLRRGRVHPLTVLTIERSYARGRQAVGSTRWVPVPALVDALDEAFYLAFGSVEATGKRHMLALDVSGSMSATIAGTVVSAREAAAALAMVAIATERAGEVTTVAFTDGVQPLVMSKRQRLDDVLAQTRRMRFGATDCAAPMLYAAEHKIGVDVFHVYTDNETWHGDVHPFQALRHYRSVMGIDAKLAVVGLTTTEFSIADPDDAGMLDVVGFDAATPALLGQFARGL